jgi:type III secretion protein C
LAAKANAHPEHSSGHPTSSASHQHSTSSPQTFPPAAAPVASQPEPQTLAAKANAHPEHSSGHPASSASNQHSTSSPKAFQPAAAPAASQPEPQTLAAKANAHPEHSSGHPASSVSNQHSTSSPKTFQTSSPSTLQTGQNPSVAIQTGKPIDHSSGQFVSKSGAEPSISTPKDFNTHHSSLEVDGHPFSVGAPLEKHVDHSIGHAMTSGKHSAFLSTPGEFIAHELEPPATSELKELSSQATSVYVASQQILPTLYRLPSLENEPSELEAHVGISEKPTKGEEQSVLLGATGSPHTQLSAHTSVVENSIEKSESPKEIKQEAVSRTSTEVEGWDASTLSKAQARLENDTDHQKLIEETDLTFAYSKQKNITQNATPQVKSKPFSYPPQQGPLLVPEMIQEPSQNTDQPPPPSPVLPVPPPSLSVPKLPEDLAPKSDEVKPVERSQDSDNPKSLPNQTVPTEQPILSPVPQQPTPSLEQTNTPVMQPAVQQPAPTPQETLTAPEQVKAVEIESLQKQPLDNKTDIADQSKIAEPPKTILINFNNVSIIEFIRFISRQSNRNFVFDENDLQFNVTIVSEEPTTIDNIMTALIQELRIHNLSLIEQGNNLIIHNNAKVNGISKIVADDIPQPFSAPSEIVTQVFRLNTLESEKAASIIRPLVSENAIIEPLKGTGHLVITDVTANVQQIATLIKSIDSPASGLVVGQYVLRTEDVDMDTIIALAQNIMKPIAQEQPLIFVPHQLSNSIFIVSTTFLVERSIFILQHLDQKQGTTKIFDLKDLRYEAPKEEKKKKPTEKTKTDKEPADTQTKEQRRENEERRLLLEEQPEEKPQGKWMLDSEGSLIFKIIKSEDEKEAQTKTAKESQQAQVEISRQAQEQLDRLIRDELEALKRRAEIEGRSELLEAELKAAEEAALKKLQEKQEAEKVKKAAPWSLGINNFEGDPFVPPPPPEIPEPLPIPAEVFSRPSQSTENFLPGPVNKTKFYIHKLNFRRGDMVSTALKQIAFTMQDCGKGNEELINTISCVQWLEETNSLVFTGSPEYLEKVRELIEQIDMPLRQVFIEMLILELGVSESLEYGVNWGNRFGGGDWAGAQAFQEGTNNLQGQLGTAGVTGLGTSVPVNPTSQFQQSLIPDPGPLVSNLTGYTLGVIGQHIVHKGLGLHFNSIGALLRALHENTNTNIVMNPKIITEDNVPAQIFVGLNIPYQSQSITNSINTLVATNYQYQDVGTSLKVTPHLGANEVITLEIEQEISNVVPPPTGSGISTQGGPTTSVNRTVTRVHVPNKYFVIISGMMQDTKQRARQQVPCLGSAPIIGGAFSRKRNDDTKTNTMVFIRPEIVDTDEEYQNVTRHQQDIWKYKSLQKKAWLYETEEALDFLNVKRTFNIYQDTSEDCPGYNH